MALYGGLILDPAYVLTVDKGHCFYNDQNDLLCMASFI